jgi:uncharacterized protein (TIGR02271 family)
VIGQDMVNRLYDCQVVDPAGEKIGSVKRVWLDGQTGDPLWASVHTGLFGLKESFVPLQRAELADDQLRVPVDKEQVKESPKIEAANDHMSDEEQAELYRHYGFGPQGGGRQQQRRPGSSQQPGDYPSRAQHAQGESGQGQYRQGQHAQGSQGAGRRRADAPETMTRSEEQLKIGTERVETGRVRLVKHVVTEEQQVSVPVTHEEVRLEREPITDATRNTVRGTEIGEAQQEMTLHAEKPVVRKETVPVEQVRLGKETVTDQETVAGTVRKEQIDIEDGREDRRRKH